MIREYELDAAEIVRICLDTQGEPGDPAEAAIEVAAALAAQAYRVGRQFGITTCTSDLAPGGGSGQFERVLDLLARMDFDPSAPHLAPQIDPIRCVLVSSRQCTKRVVRGLHRPCRKLGGGLRTYTWE